MTGRVIFIPHDYRQPCEIGYEVAAVRVGVASVLVEVGGKFYPRTFDPALGLILPAQRDDPTPTSRHGRRR